MYNREDISEQFACEYTMGKLLKMIEEFNEDLKMRAIHVLTKIVCDKQARQHYLDLGGPNYLLKYIYIYVYIYIYILLLVNWKLRKEQN